MPEIVSVGEGIYQIPEYGITIDISDMVVREIPFARRLSRSYFIRYYLSVIRPRGEYVYRMWEVWNLLRGAVYVKGKMCPTTYSSFRNAIYVLKTLGLIREVPPPQPSEEVPTAFPRVFYRIQHSRINDPAWDNPLKEWRRTRPKTGMPPVAPGMETISAGPTRRGER